MGLYVDNPIIKPLGSLIVIAIASSRVYLGAHYPIDVIGGFLIGACLAGGFWLLEENNIFEKCDGSLSILVATGIVLACYFTKIKEQVPMASAGSLVGLMLSRHLLDRVGIKDMETNQWESLLLVVVGIAGMIAIRRSFVTDTSSYKNESYFAKYMIQIIYLFFITPLLFKAFL